jgi:hypothetical protein
MNHHPLALLAILAACLLTERQGLAAEDANAPIQAIERRIEALSKELAEIKTQRASAPAAKPPAEPTVQPPAPAQAKSAAPGTASSLPEWIKRVKLFGDFRYRHEHTEDETQAVDRDRDRIQLHLGLMAAVNDDLDLIARLSSGNNAAPVSREEAGSPTSGNQDLDDAFSRKNIWIDLACLDYHPVAIKGLDVLAGKMKNPFFTPGRSDLLLDRDVTPEGGALTYTTKRVDPVTLFGAAGGFWVEERSTRADTGLWAIQAGLTVPVPGVEAASVTTGTGYYDYADVRGRAALGPAGSFFGNRSSGGTYASDFRILQGFAEVRFPVVKVPCTIFGDVLKNTAASGEDQGYYVGFGIGKCGKPGSWELLYNYRDLEADAVVAVLTEVTFAGGGTNVRGHVLSFAYQLLEGLQFVATYMPAERTNTSTGATTDYNTILLDLVARF